MADSIQLHFIDYLLLATYFLFVIGIGVVLKRNVSGSNDFFESGRSLPSWVCALGLFGLVSNRAIHEQHSLGININLAWNVVQLLFGVSMVGLALRAKRNAEH